MRYDEPYGGEDRRVALMAGERPLYRVLSSLGYDLAPSPRGCRVICRGTAGVEFAGDAAGCWEWLERRGHLQAYAERRHEKKRRMEARKAAAEAAAKQGELAL